MIFQLIIFHLQLNKIHHNGLTVMDIYFHLLTLSDESLSLNFQQIMWLNIPKTGEYLVIFPKCMLWKIFEG